MTHDATPPGPAPGDTALRLEEAPEHLEGLVVVDRDEHRVGEVDGVLVDGVDHRTRMLVVGSGGILGLGRVRRLVPLEDVADVTDRVRITTSHRDVHLVAPYDPAPGAASPRPGIHSPG